MSRRCGPPHAIIQVRVPVEALVRVQQVADERGSTVSAVVREAIAARLGDLVAESPAPAQEAVHA